MATNPITVHCAALAPLRSDLLGTESNAIADWLMANAPGCFVRLYVVDTWIPHVLVPAARWRACGADVLMLEEGLYAD